MASISSLGIGSNLPLDTLLTNLTTAEKARLTPITRQQSANSAKLTAYGTLKSALEKFQTANTALNSADLFKSTTATSSSDKLAVTTSAGAAAGTYTISVSQLAQAQSLATRTLTSSSAPQGDSAIASRTLVISQKGRDKPLEIELSAEQTSLEGIRDAINEADGGVTASIVKLKDDSYQLVLSATDSGVDNAMTISVSGDATLQNLLGYDNSTGSGAMTQLVAARNALLTVNNIAIERASNTVTDAPQGLTLNLSQTLENATVIVSKSNDKATSAVNDWVNAWNSLVDTFNSLTKYTAVDQGAETQDASNGALVGDSIVRNIQTGIRAQFSNSATGSTFKTLAEIGVTQDPTTGKLKIDDDKLQKALTDNSSATRQLLVGDGKETGITSKIAGLVSGYLADDGIIDSAKDGINATLKSLTKQYLAVSNSIDETIARYKTQFTQLDTIISQLNSTSSYLTQQFDALSSS
ncbi:flagellar filament capping protein FliD [Entomohabitans teleogrylli]|uniref:flagellar filament capping protein FliD n=1 Tax=Entomohabitans teleogrylli TaxID=1384589 RepID=UPI00073DA16D|nr:flagellar filament capping protein FliD [Entomohabitans teleogrylli]